MEAVRAAGLEVVAACSAARVAASEATGAARKEDAADVWNHLIVEAHVSRVLDAHAPIRRAPIGKAHQAAGGADVVSASLVDLATNGDADRFVVGRFSQRSHRKVGDPEVGERVGRLASRADGDRVVVGAVVGGEDRRAERAVRAVGEGEKTTEKSTSMGPGPVLAWSLGVIGLTKT